MKTAVYGLTCIHLSNSFKTTNFFAAYLINNTHIVNSHFVNSHSVVNVDKVGTDNGRVDNIAKKLVVLNKIRKMITHPYYRLRSFIATQNCSEKLMKWELTKREWKIPQ